MSDLAESGQMPHRIHNIMRRLPFWLVDYQGPVKWRWLRLFWHGI
jgi:hypothetical protein